jgi:hypothetical protein
MGYYTEYRLQVIDDNLGFIDHEKGISNTVTYDPFMSHCQWYECDDHMLEYSVIYPEFTFILNGTGEEPNDRWKSYYKNGKSFTTQAKIIFEEYNESKLK